MIEPLRLSIFEPKLIFHKRDIKLHDRDILTQMNGNFHCLYRLPNSILPRFHSKIILTTKQIAVVTSVYDEGALFSISNFENVEIKQDFLRMYTGETTIEVELGCSEGASFAEIVLESWKDITGEYTSDLSEKDSKHIEEQISSLQEREEKERQ